MSYALIENGQVVEYPINSLFDKYPNISFTLPLEATQFPSGIIEVQAVQAPVVEYTQDVIEETPVEVNGVWKQSWTIIPAPTEEIERRVQALKGILQRAVQSKLDDFARTRNYDNILSCTTYYNSAVSKFQQEAQYCIQMRDAYWSACYSILQQFESGQRSMPTVEQLLGELPVLQWPN
jgi:hypothetical protein